MKILALDGQLVGALISHEPALAHLSELDRLHALVLVNGVSFVVRNVPIPRLNYHLGVEYFRRAEKLKKLAGSAHFRIEEGRICYARRFFPSRCTLTENIPFIDSLLPDLEQTLQSFTERGVFHGAIDPSNIFRVNERWVCVDYGFTFLLQHQPIAGESYEDYLRLGTEADLRALSTLSEMVRQARTSKRPSQALERGGSGNFLYRFVLVGLCLLFGVLYKTNSVREFVRSFIPVLNSTQGEALTPEQLRAFWASEKLENLKRVAYTAVLEKNELAKNIILEGVLDGRGIDHVFADVIITGHKLPWRKLLTEDDANILFGFSLLSLLPDDFRSLPKIQDASITVLFALASGLPEGNSREAAVVELLRRSSELPSPFRESLLLLGQSGMRASGIVHAVCNILMGRFSEEFLRMLFSDGLTSKEGRTALLAIVPSLSEEEAEGVYAFLESDPHWGSKDPLAWFRRSSLVNWKTASALLKLQILTEDATLLSQQATRTLDQEADLLTYPSSDVRNIIVSDLQNSVFRDSSYGSLLSVLTSEQSLSREQVITLVAALSTQGESHYGFIQQWFATSPSPTSVLHLLLARAQEFSRDQRDVRENAELDSFSLSATRYLKKNTEWKATTDELNKMANHPEPLARALAYSRLDASGAAEHQILQDRLHVESDETLKELLRSRLSSKELAESKN
ncbi:MAG: hypothetical protein KDD60_01730 [Bdellovibrionales bacterium]|nr:hypothetical protein [Bdellovibrionales bacterium]